MKHHFYHAKSALSNETCNSIIDSFNRVDDSKKHLGPSNPYCKSNNIHFFQYMKMSVDTNSILHAPLIKHLKIYGINNPFLTNTTPWGVNPKCMIQKYLPGEHYGVEHCEQNPTDSQVLRMLAWMFYLNDIEDGGGTAFPQQNVELKARTGDLYIWPAFWTYSHYGIPAKSEIKYIITGWCEYHSYLKKPQSSDKN